MSFEMASMATIAVVGAGIAGLVCAQALQMAGHQVLVLEKSRGVGGRMATRRVAGTFADHGVRYLISDGDRLGQLLGVLHDRRIVRAWRGAIAQILPDGNCHLLSHSRRYVGREGINAVAKWLAQGLTIYRQHQVVALQPEGEHWNLTVNDTHAVEPTPASFPDALAIDAVVLAIPAPQASALLAPLGEWGLPQEIQAAVDAVEFEPCLTAIATYPAHQWDALDHSQSWHGVLFEQHPDLAWIAFENSKRPTATQEEDALPVFIFQSTAAFAQQYLSADHLDEAAHHLMKQAAEHLYEWIASPVEVSVHRWRYAIAHHCHPQPYLATQKPLPLVCSGDWCGGNQVQDAIASGLASATYLNQDLGASLETPSWSQIITTLGDRP